MIWPMHFQPGQLFPINSRYALEVIDFSNFSPDCAAPGKGVCSDRAVRWDKTRGNTISGYASLSPRLVPEGVLLSSPSPPHVIPEN